MIHHSCGFSALQAQKKNNNGFEDQDAFEESPDLIQFSDSESEDDFFEKDNESTCSSSDYEGDSEDNDDCSSDTNSNAPEKCAICLLPQMENKAFASGCFHKFCFKCLLEWSKVRPECPLCKRRFDRIVYDCRSNTDFKEYYLPSCSTSSDAQQELAVEQALLTPPGSPDSGYTSVTQHPPRQQPLQRPQDDDPAWSKASWIVGKQSAPVLFRVLVYTNEWYVDPTLKCESSINEEDGRTLAHYTSQSFMKQERFRALLSSPQWYREHEPLLMAWLARELCALAHVANSTMLAANQRYNLLQLDKLLLMELLDKLVKLLLLQLLDKLVYDEEDLAVVESVAELMHLPRRVARHFVHELTFFLASPMCRDDLVEYDAHAVYYERSKAMKRRRFLSGTMLPVNLTKFRLVPPPPSDSEGSAQFGVDMARNFVAAGLDKEDYVKRILMLHCDEMNHSDDVEAKCKRSHEEMMDSASTESVLAIEDVEIASSPSSCFTLSSDDECEPMEEDPPTPPPTPVVSMVQQEPKKRCKNAKKRALNKKH